MCSELRVNNARVNSDFKTAIFSQTHQNTPTHTPTNPHTHQPTHPPTHPLTPTRLQFSDTIKFPIRLNDYDSYALSNAEITKAVLDEVQELDFIGQGAYLDMGESFGG